MWRNPDQVGTNQDVRIYLKTTLPYNNLFSLKYSCRFLCQTYLCGSGIFGQNVVKPLFFRLNVFIEAFQKICRVACKDRSI